MNTLLNSNSGNKTYIFKDGNLLQGVTLPPKYSIVDDYITCLLYTSPSPRDA